MSDDLENRRSEIDHYWKDFERLRNRLIEKWQDIATIREIYIPATRLAEAVEQEIAQTNKPHPNLINWAHTFHDFVGQLAVDLEQTEAAIAAFRTALKYSGDDIETHVHLIRELCRQGAFREAIRQLDEIRRLGISFLRSTDWESAAHLLELICNHHQIARHVDSEVLRDLVEALAQRGNVSVVLNPEK
jgi:methionine synthase II (cobalamin-independent)